MTFAYGETRPLILPDFFGSTLWESGRAIALTFVALVLALIVIKLVTKLVT